MADWATISSLATAGGTLVLAAATFAAVRSANRSARVTERALLAGIRPLVLPSRLEDPAEKVGFLDDHWLKVPGGRASVDVTDDVIYLAIALRNVGSGLAVLDRWELYPERLRGTTAGHPPESFHRLTRDLYIAAGDRGFWQGAFRDPDEPIFAEVAKAVVDRQPMTVELLYGDHEGGQRTITRFGLIPHTDGGWLAVAVRHWNLDRADPR